MNIYLVKRRVGASLWVLAMLEMALVLACVSMAKSLETADIDHGLYTLCNVGLYLNGVALIGLLIGYFLLPRLLGVPRDVWKNGRAMTSLDAAYQQSPQGEHPVRRSLGWLLPFSGVMAIIIGLSLFVILNRIATPSLFTLVEKQSVTELTTRLEADPAAVDGRNKGGLTALMVAVDAGETDMVALLLEHGASVGMTDRSGRTALIHAIGHPGIVDQLLQRGASPNITDESGMTALHWAVRKGSEDDVRLLLQYGARVNVRNADADTPLLMAIAEDAPSVNILLMHGADPNMADQIGEAPLHLAAKYDQLATTQALLAAGAEAAPVSMQGWTPLHLAALNGSLSVIPALLQAGVNVDIENRRSQTPLTCAILKNHPPVVEYLLDHGARLGHTDRNGNTSLHIALIEHRDQIASLLISSGADITIANDAGVTPEKLMKMDGKTFLLKKQGVVSSR